MPPIRFRIRTVMIAIVVLAVLMFTLTGILRSNAQVGLSLMTDILFAAAVVAAVVVVPIAVVIEFSVFAVFFCRGRTHRRQFLRKDSRPFRRPKPDQSGEPERA